MKLKTIYTMVLKDEKGTFGKKVGDIKDIKLIKL